MYQKQVQYLINFLMLLDALITIAGVYWAAYINRVLHDFLWDLTELNKAYLALFLMFTGNFIMDRLGLYSDKRPQSFLHTVRDVLISQGILYALLSGVIFGLHYIVLGRMFILLCAGITTALFIGVRAVFAWLLNDQKKAAYSYHRILLLGQPERVRMMHEALAKQNSWGHTVIGYLRAGPQSSPPGPELDCLGGIADFADTLTRHSVDEVVFCLAPGDAEVNLRALIDTCEEIGTSFRIVPALFDPLRGRQLRVESVQGIPTLIKSTGRIDIAGLFYKRILDYAVGSVGFLIFLLLYPILGLLIKLDSPGPVLFRQLRVGEHGRLFHIFKFRTMVQDADKRLPELMAKNEMKGHMFKMERDPRVTRLGDFLRKSSLDEFPQFLNVMRGEMSLVGTRPPTVEEVARYETRHRRRISIKPGITGLWQISGRNKIVDFEQVLKLDLQYIDNWRFWDDIVILWKTVWVVLARKGAI